MFPEQFSPSLILPCSRVLPPPSLTTTQAICHCSAHQGLAAGPKGRKQPALNTLLWDEGPACNFLVFRKAKPGPGTSGTSAVTQAIFGGGGVGGTVLS